MIIPSPLLSCFPSNRVCCDAVMLPACALSLGSAVVDCTSDFSVLLCIALQLKYLLGVKNALVFIHLRQWTFGWVTDSIMESQEKGKLCQNNDTEFLNIWLTQYLRTMMVNINNQHFKNLSRSCCFFSENMRFWNRINNLGSFLIIWDAMSIYFEIPSHYTMVQWSAQLPRSQTVVSLILGTLILWSFFAFSPKQLGLAPPHRDHKCRSSCDMK